MTIFKNVFINPSKEDIKFSEELYASPLRIRKIDRQLTITVSNEATWPPEIIKCLDKHYDIFYSHEASLAGLPDISWSASKYDLAHEDLRQTLNPFSLRGYHCSRLTDFEIIEIKNNGMKLQNGETLMRRINMLLQRGLIDNDTAVQLKSKNQADDDNRARMLWFCFFYPSEAGEDGIERLLRYWGGEALFNSHELNPKTGPVLKSIGTPCIVEADVPVSSLSRSSSLPMKIARIYLKNRGLATRECCNFESYAQMDILSQNIIRIIEFGEDDFISLTDCNNWDVLLSVGKENIQNK